MFVRVKAKDTKHEFDVPEEDARIGDAFELIKGDQYPKVDRPRPAKYHVASKGTTKNAPARADTKEAE